MLFQPVFSGRGEIVVWKRRFILLSQFGSAFPLRFVHQTLYIYAPVLGRKSEQMCHPALADVLKTPTSAGKQHLNPQNRYR
jgi:hypothetical protein